MAADVARMMSRRYKVYTMGIERCDYKPVLKSINYKNTEHQHPLLVGSESISQ